MKAIFTAALLMLMVSGSTLMVRAQGAPPIVVSWDDGLPVADSHQVSRSQLASLLPGASFVSAAELPRALKEPTTRLLVIPNGSAFAEGAWPAIYSFLQRGGNLLTLGGRPFTRPAYRDGGSWKLRPETYAFARQLFIHDYQPTPGSSTLEQRVEVEALSGLPAFDWENAFSLVTRLSDETTSSRDGATGTLDARLTTIVAASKDNRRLSAPVIQIDHLRNAFVGGRWIMVNCVPAKNFYAGNASRNAVAMLAKHAMQGAEEFSVSPAYPLFLPNEPWQFRVAWNRLQQPPVAARLVVVVESDGKREATQTLNIAPGQFPFTTDLVVASNGRPGLHTVVARLTCGNTLCGAYRTGFWVRDSEFLRSGPKVTVDRDFFRIDGHAVPVVGTTYMASDVQRQFFRYPNPHVWDSDMEQISRAGLNMLRTGWWTDWDQVTGGSGVATEHTLRTLEAFLLTARKHNLPVQFTFFAFMPEVLGGENAYLDPEAVRRQQELVQSVVERFKDVPFLMWDLINEPSFDNPKRLWSTRPNGDAHELRSWNEWLTARYPDRAALQSAWKTVLSPAAVPVPDDRDFSVRSANAGGRPLATYDFNIFAQEKFRDWVQTLRTTIRQTGSQQLITVGQDEAGGQFGPSPAFFSPAVDFTTMHSWWANDDLLWDSLVAKQQGLPMLVQETGLQHEFSADARPRRNAANEASLLERKIAIAMGTGAGAIQWLWNVNSYMRLEAEVTIGAVRPDGTEKLDADVIRAFATFANSLRDRVGTPEPPQVAIVSSQALQFSVLGKLSLDAQTRAVRAMNYSCRTPARLVAENRIEDIGGSKLVVLPSAQALTDTAWTTLLEYVDGGGNLLITGPVERDQHWLRTERLKQLGLKADPEPLTYRGTSLRLGDQTLEVGFGQAVQERAEALRTEGGQSFVEVARGKGKIFLASHPVELAESPEPTEQLYRHVLARLGIKAAFESRELPPAVLIRPVAFGDYVLYLVISESSHDEDVDVEDRLTGARLHFTLPAQRAKLFLISKSDGRVIATYNGPDL